MSTSTLVSFLMAIVLAAPSAWADGIQISDNGGYTNLSFTVTGLSGACTITAKDLSGATVGSPVEKTVTSGTPFVVATSEFGSGFQTGKTYVYTVTDSLSQSLATSFTDAGVVTGQYFSAVASGTTYTKVNGDWVEAPTVADGQFQIDSTQATFKVENDGVSATRKVITIDCNLDLDTYYFEDDLTNDVLSATAAIALVTNDEQAASGTWMVMTNGSEWVKVTGATVLLGSYQARIQLDYNTARPFIRYSVSADAGSTWSALKTSDGTEWFLAQTAAPTVSNVCFVGKSDVSSLVAQLSTTGIAEVNGIDQSDISAAMSIAKEQEKTVVLYTNVKVDPSSLVTGSYAFNFNGKTFETTDHAWTKGDGSAKVVTTGSSSLLVEEKALVAAIGTDDSAPAYVALGPALAAGANTNVTLLANIAENATSEVQNVTLDLAGYKLTKGGAGEAPVLYVKGGSILLVSSAEGGSITGATSVAAIQADNAAVVAIDGIAVSNNTAYALRADNGALITVSNGWFLANGGFATDEGNESKILFVSGFYADSANYVNLVKASGGYFADGATTDTITNVPTDHVVALAVPFTTNAVTFTKTIDAIITNASGGTVEAKAYVVTNSQGEAQGTVQLPDTFVEAAAPGKAGAEAQAELQTPAAFNSGKATGMTKWHCYVLGMESAATTSTTEGPYVKGVQDAKPGKIGFQMLTPSAIKAKEAGCDVKFQVEEYDAPTGGSKTRSSALVNYDQAAEIDAPATGSTARYYKLKVVITPNK